MQFERFDPELVGRVTPAAGAVVRVDDAGRVLFSGAAWGFLTRQYGVDSRDLEVSLLFDAAERVAAVQPLLRGDDVAASARYRPVVMRSTVWPRAVDARSFVDFWLIGMGEYRARLTSGPGPKMVAFGVGPNRRPRVGAELLE